MKAKTTPKTADVVSLRGDLLPGETHADTVECLERLLGMARRGEVVGLVYGAVKANDHITVGSVGGGNYWTLIAAANLAVQDVLDRHREENG